MQKVNERARPYLQWGLVNVTRPDKWSHNTKGQSYKANFGINYIKNGLNNLNFTLNYINFDVIFAKKFYRIDPFKVFSLLFVILHFAPVFLYLMLFRIAFCELLNNSNI